MRGMIYIGIYSHDKNERHNCLASAEDGLSGKIGREESIRNRFIKWKDEEASYSKGIDHVQLRGVDGVHSLCDAGVVLVRHGPGTSSSVQVLSWRVH